MTCPAGDHSGSRQVLAPIRTFSEISPVFAKPYRASDCPWCPTSDGPVCTGSRFLSAIGYPPSAVPRYGNRREIDSTEPLRITPIYYCRLLLYIGTPTPCIPSDPRAWVHLGFTQIILGVIDVLIPSRFGRTLAIGFTKFPLQGMAL